MWVRAAQCSVCREYKPRLCFGLVRVQTNDSKLISVNQGLAVPGFVCVCINQLLIYECTHQGCIHKG